MTTFAIASDHAGVELKVQIINLLLKQGKKITDFGTNSLESVDYPDFAAMVTEAVVSGRAEKGILICGTGIGMSIAANRSRAIRAALCHNTMTAELARQHNDANVLVLGARVVDTNTALSCVEAFLNTPFEGGRHQNRLNKLS
jgi:ribose 5-phosphate isomerase B